MPRRPWTDEVPHLRCGRLVRQPGLDHLVLDGQRIGVTWVQRHYGPEALWVCPQCNQRKRDLYLVDGQWRCRKCSGVLYEREYWGGSTLQGKLCVAYNIIRRLRRRLDPYNEHPGVLVPPRRRFVHADTYVKHRDAILKVHSAIEFHSLVKPLARLLEKSTALQKRQTRTTKSRKAGNPSHQRALATDQRP